MGKYQLPGVVLAVRRRIFEVGRYNFRHADDCSNHSGDTHNGIPLCNADEALVPIARAFCVALWPATLQTDKALRIRC